eukprot:14269265-Ditylum_brightwellii.AAC.1
MESLGVEMCICTDSGVRLSIGATRHLSENYENMQTQNHGNHAKFGRGGLTLPKNSVPVQPTKACMNRNLPDHPWVLQSG